jgi:adenylyl-sulfate kinase
VLGFDRVQVESGSTSMRRATFRRSSGFVIWLTGLSASGKTTIARSLESHLEECSYLVECLDGDDVREHLSQGLGFSRRDRGINVSRIAWVASRVARAGGIVIASLISPHADARQRARAMVEDHSPFIEVYISTPLAVCVGRDPKGLYRRALAGEISDFTGVSDPYETPLKPDIEIDTSQVAVADATATILRYIEHAGLVSSIVPEEATKEPLPFSASSALPRRCT